MVRLSRLDSIHSPFNSNSNHSNTLHFIPINHFKPQLGQIALIPQILKIFPNFPLIKNSNLSIDQSLLNSQH